MRAIGTATAALAAAAALFAAAATPAAADDKSLADAVKESKPLKRNGRLDITRVMAGHKGELLAHTVVMRKKVAPERGKERPVLAINTRGGRRSDAEYLIFGGALFKQPKKGDPKRVGDVEVVARGRRWIYRWDPEQIPGLKKYGWTAVTNKGNAFDIAPADRYLWHRL